MQDTKYVGHLQPSEYFKLTVSCFKNYKSPNNPKEVSLWKWLTSRKYKAQVDIIRSTSDLKKRKHYKSKLPAITPSGTFVQRKNNCLIQHSGFICIDIDHKDNKHIGNFSRLKNELSNIKNIAYCGLSVSGEGYFALIPILYPKQHEKQFLALYEDFKSFGIKIDSTKDVSRLRGYSYDDDAYFNTDATFYEKVHSQTKSTYRSEYSNSKPSQHADRQRVETLIRKIEANHTDVTTGYNTWLAIAFGFASVFGESGRDFFHRVSQFYPKYSTSETDKKYDSALRNGRNGNLGAFFNACKTYQITFK